MITLSKNTGGADQTDHQWRVDWTMLDGQAQSRTFASAWEGAGYMVLVAVARRSGEIADKMEMKQ